MSEIVIWAVKEGKTYRAGVSDAKISPIPFSAEIITRTQKCDERIMLEWVKKRIKRGWPIDKIKAAC